MNRLRVHPETHLVDRIGWLRPAVLGANDGIISTASLKSRQGNTGMVSVSPIGTIDPRRGPA